MPSHPPPEARLPGRGRAGREPADEAPRGLHREDAAVDGADAGQPGQHVARPAAQLGPRQLQPRPRRAAHPLGEPERQRTGAEQE